MPRRVRALHRASALPRAGRFHDARSIRLRSGVSAKVGCPKKRDANVWISGCVTPDTCVVSGEDLVFRAAGIAARARARECLQRLEDDADRVDEAFELLLVFRLKRAAVVAIE